jgi:hypothetical protein
VHRRLLDLAHALEPDDPAAGVPPCSGATVRTKVELILGHLRIRCLSGGVPAWLRPKVEHLVTVLRRLGPGLYHCYDVPGLPRTDNGLEQFYRRVKSEQRRITGRKRADAFVVRVGGFAVYATAASTVPEAALLRRLAAVPAAHWQQERGTLRANQDRQAKMRRFRLAPAAYLADLEARWSALAHPP